MSDESTETTSSTRAKSTWHAEEAMMVRRDLRRRPRLLPRGDSRPRPAARDRRSAAPARRQLINPDDIDIERRDDETMIINMGPQHPSTHGVLRLMLELDGETVLRTKPIIGYLHTGMEKTGEELTYVQGSTNVTRMDYLSPLNNELVFSLATEALLGRGAASAGHVDPDAHGRTQPGVVPPDVDGHQRYGPRLDFDDDLRLP